MDTQGHVTRLLAAAREGDPEAIGAIFPVVYAELRSMARRQLRGSGPNATLSPTAVVHEAYVKLIGASRVDVRDRSHFFAVAATVMRQILVDRARKHLTHKRGGGSPHTLLDEEFLQVEARASELLDLDAALDRLARVDERLARVVDLRFFAGLSVEETAELLAVAPVTIKRDWRRARAFLLRELDESQSP